MSGVHLLSMFRGCEVPVRFQKTAEEREADAIQAMVNGSEEEALDCLTGLLKKTTSALDKAESRLIEEKEKSTTNGSRTTSFKSKGRQRRRSLGGRMDLGMSDVANMADVEDADVGWSDDDEDGDGVEGERDGGAGARGEGGGEERAALIMPVAQGVAMPDELTDAAEGGEAGGADGRPARNLSEVRPDDRLRRILLGDAAGAEPLDTWPQKMAVPIPRIVACLRRVPFFRDSHLQDEALAKIATWFEVQYYESLTAVAEEGRRCHSLYILYRGTLEARGALHDAGKQRGRAHSRRMRQGELDVVRPPAAIGEDGLPQPTLQGPFESLQPLLLHGGAHFGEAALCSVTHPHTCSVRTVQRCVLLVLRRTIVAQQLQLLQKTSLHAWEVSRARRDALHAALASRWLHHQIRRLPLLCKLPLKCLPLVNAIADHRTIPAGWTLLRPGDRVAGLVLLLQGELGLHDPTLRAEDTAAMRASLRLSAGGASALSPRSGGMGAEEEGAEARLPPLCLLVTERSSIPLVGDEPLLLPTAVAAAGGAPSRYLVRARTACVLAVLPYSELARRDVVLAELRKLVSEARVQPRGLMAALQQSAHPQSFRGRTPRGAPPAAAQATPNLPGRRDSSRSGATCSLIGVSACTTPMRSTSGKPVANAWMTG